MASKNSGKQKDLSGKTKPVKRELNAEISKTRLSAIMKPMMLVSDEAVLKCTKDGIEFCMVDPAHVCMIQIDIPKKLFSSWKVKFPKQEKDLKICIDMKKLKEFLKLADGMDEIKMNFDTESNRIVMQLGKITRTFHLIDPTGYSKPKVPNLNLTAEAHIKVKDIRPGVDAISDISDHLRMKKEGNEFFLIGKGDTDEVEFKMDKDQLDKLEGEDGASLFPLVYFSNFIKSVPAGDVLEIHFAHDYPCSIDIEARDGWTMTYLLAPRIEAEDTPEEKPDSKSVESDSDKKEEAEAEESEEATE